MPEEFQTDSYPRPDDTFVIDNLETLKVMADPQRLRVLEEMIEGPRTVKQLAAALDTTPTKLYYHMNLLEEHGLIRVVSTRVVSGIIEKLYHVRAHSYPLDRSLLALAESSSDEGLPTIISSVLDHTAMEIKRGIKSGLIDLGRTEDDYHNLILSRTLSKLSPQRAHEFIKRFEALMKEFDDCTYEGANDPDSRVYGLTIALYPTHHTSLPDRTRTEEKNNG